MTTCGYQLLRIAGPEFEPITLEQAKLQCKVDADITQDDELLEEMIGAAREYAEEHCRRTWCETTWELTLENFPATVWYPTAIELPMGPVLEILSVSYLDSDGASQDVDVSTLQLNKGEPPTIRPAFGAYWPSARNAVTIRYRAGYPSIGSPATGALVPKRVKQALRMMVGHWYENREAVFTETRQIPAEISHGWDNLLQQLRVLP